MKKPVLLSAVVGPNVREGEVCPFCGGKKTKGASSCVHCRHKYGGRSEAKMAVDEALEAIEEAFKGHAAAIASDPDRARQLVFEGFTMMELKAKKGAVEPANTAIEPYVPVGIYIDGGWYNISAFGLEQVDLSRKTWVAGIFQHKSKKVGESTVHYGRFQ